MNRSVLALGAALVLAPLVAFAGAGTPNAQVAEGQKLYGSHCSKCHGDGGQGSKNAPPVVGKAALPLDPPAGAKLRKVQFHTAKDVLDWASAHMPPKKAGTLKKSEYEAIIAFDLQANGVDMTGKHLDEKTAASFVLHP